MLVGRLAFSFEMIPFSAGHAFIFGGLGVQQAVPKALPRDKAGAGGGPMHRTSDCTKPLVSGPSRINDLLGRRFPCDFFSDGKVGGPFFNIGMCFCWMVTRDPKTNSK